MNQMLKPKDIDIMRSALELRAEPLDIKRFNIMYSTNLENPFTEDQKHAQLLLKRLDEFCADPNSGLLLSKDDIAFLIDAINYSINLDQEIILTERKVKQIKYCENEIRIATACVSRLKAFSVSLDA